jgi:hypothetical protein
MFYLLLALLVLSLLSCGALAAPTLNSFVYAYIEPKEAFWLRLAFASFVVASLFLIVIVASH